MGWCFVHVVEKAFTDPRGGPVPQAVGPALTDGLQQQHLGPAALQREVGQLKNALGDGHRRPLSPAGRNGQEVKGGEEMENERE